MLPKPQLIKYYLFEKRSVSGIAKKMHCSQNKVTYWLGKYRIPKRTISEAVYVQKNPKGDPFHTPLIKSHKDAFLFGLGLGLYWGEGTKANTGAVRLGNSDPALIKTFMMFLKNVYGVDMGKLRFGIQIFSDIDPGKALHFWSKGLKVSMRQFYKPYVTISVRKGTYTSRSKYGVVTLYMGNTKLRNILVDEIEKLRSVYYDSPVLLKKLKNKPR